MQQNLTNLDDFIFSSIISSDDKNSVYKYDDERDLKSKYIEYFIAYIQARMKLLSRSITCRGGIKKLNKSYDNDLFKSTLIKLIETCIEIPRSILDEIFIPRDKLITFDDDYVTQMKFKLFETAVDYRNADVNMNEDDSVRVSVSGKVILRNLIHSLFTIECNTNLEDLKLKCLRKLFREFESTLNPSEYAYVKYAIAFAIHISIPTNFIKNDDIDFDSLFHEFSEFRYIDYADYLLPPVHTRLAPLTTYINFPGTLKSIIHYMRRIDLRKSIYMSHKAVSDISLLDPQKILGSIDIEDKDTTGLPNFKLSQINLCKMMLELYNWFDNIDSSSENAKSHYVCMSKKGAGLIKFEPVEDLKFAVGSLMELTSELKRHTSLFNAILYDGEDKIIEAEKQKIEESIEKMEAKKIRYIQELATVPNDETINSRNRAIVIHNKIFVCEKRIEYMQNLILTFDNILNSKVLSLLKETNLRDSLLEILNKYVDLAAKNKIAIYIGKNIKTVTDERLQNTNPIYNILPNNSGDLINNKIMRNVDDDVNIYENKLNTGLTESPIYDKCNCMITSSLLSPGHISGYCGRDSGSLFIDFETPDIDGYDDSNIPIDAFVKHFKDNLHKVLFYNALPKGNDTKEVLDKIEKQLYDASIVTLNTSSFHGSSIHAYLPLTVSYEDFKSWIIRLRGILHNNSDEINFTDYIDECAYMFSLNYLRLPYSVKGRTLFRFNDQSNIDIPIKKQELLKYTFMDIEESLKENASRNDGNMQINKYMYDVIYENMFPFFFKLFLSALNKKDGGEKFNEPDKSKGSLILLGSNMNYHRLYIDKRRNGTNRFRTLIGKRKFFNDVFYKFLFINNVQENKWISSISTTYARDEISNIHLDKLSSLKNVNEEQNSFGNFRKNIKSFINGKVHE